MYERVSHEANQIYNQLIQNPQDDELCMQYRQKNEHLSNLMRKIAVESSQRMKLNWLTQGDKTSKTFHCKMAIPKNVKQMQIFS